MKSNNPANLNSQSAKQAGLSYWDYMAKTYPGCVKPFVWGVKKVTRKQKREKDAVIMSAMASSNHPVMRLMVQMRALLGKNRIY